MAPHIKLQMSFIWFSLVSSTYKKMNLFKLNHTEGFSLYDWWWGIMYRSQLLLQEYFNLHEMLWKSTAVALLCWPLSHPGKPEVHLSIEKLINKIHLISCIIQRPLESGSETLKQRDFFPVVMEIMLWNSSGRSKKKRGTDVVSLGESELPDRTRNWLGTADERILWCVSKAKETPGRSDLGSAVNQKFWGKSKPLELEQK